MKPALSYKTIFYFFSALFILIAPLVSTAIVNPIQFNTIPDIFSAIVSFLRVMATPIGIIMFLYGGFMYLTSAGSQERVKTAHRIMTWSAVGIGVVLAGTVLVKIICAFLETTDCIVNSWV